MVKNLKFRLVDDKNQVLFELAGQLEFDETNEFDEGELVFQHPFTGEMYTDVKQCMVGWSEQTEADEEARWELAEAIADDKELLELAWCEDEGDVIDYYK